MIPTVLTGDENEALAQINLVQTHAPELDLIQIDVIDGQFAPSLTVGPDDLIGVDWDNQQIDWHLMSNEVYDQTYDLVGENKKAWPTRAIIAQIEHLDCEPAAFIDLVAKNEFKPGFSLDLYTPIEEIEPAWFDEGLKIVQLMAVEAGAQGQEFNQEIVFTKIAELRELLKENQLSPAELELIIDGGIKSELLPEIIAQTRDFGQVGLGIGSALWRGNFAENYQNFSEAIEACE